MLTALLNMQYGQPPDRRSFSKLTARQRAVLDGIAKRSTIKAIAADLGISESAVNQHIKTLKVRLCAHSLTDLARIYSEISDASDALACRKTTYRKKHLPETPVLHEEAGEDEITPSQTFHDSLSYRRVAPWDIIETERLGFGVLNAFDSKWTRSVAIVAMTIGLFVAVLVGLGAIQGVSNALADQGHTPKATN